MYAKIRRPVILLLIITITSFTLIRMLISDRIASKRLIDNTNVKINSEKDKFGGATINKKPLVDAKLNSKALIPGYMGKDIQGSDSEKEKLGGATINKKPLVDTKLNSKALMPGCMGNGIQGSDYEKEKLGGATINKKPLVDAKLKYILRWNGEALIPGCMGDGSQGFLSRKCPVSNCFVTNDRNYLNDSTRFDAVIFSGPQVVRMSKFELPRRRSPKQKYIFASGESPHYYPACKSSLNGYFNWTWTYRLDSDARWDYIAVRNSTGSLIGPSIEMHWTEEMKPIDDSLKKKLKSKSKAAAWFVSNCNSRSGREKFAEEVQKHLSKFGLTVDVYGSCGKLRCSRDDMESCLEMLEKDYYFYFSFENSFSEDYVTEKLLHALQHNTVPVVFGGANYTRFVPDGIYLNARSLGPEKLAEKMHALINNTEEYYDFFKYKGHYSFHMRQESLETDNYCKICDMLNNRDLTSATTVHDDLQKWWNPRSFDC